MKATNILDPNYFHKVVDCQWACPAHTPVPEYIRLIAQQRYTEAYMINWDSNVFPGILGRTCDRPCEPVCRRVRTEEKPVAICRLKRVAADHKGDITAFLPRVPVEKNGKKSALLGAGPASLAVARDMLPFGYEIDMFDRDSAGGGMMRSQIPAFRLPADVLDEEVDLILNMGVNTHFDYEITSMRAMLDMNYDAYFVGTGAPRGRDLDIPGRTEVDEHISIGIDWLSSVAFGHTTSISGKVIVMGGGNTAMDCCRTSARLGAESVTVVVRSAFEVMKASEWEKEEAINEDIPIINNRPPKEFIHENGKLKGVLFECVTPIEENPILDEDTLQSTNPEIFFGGDSALGPENIIWASAHAHKAAISMHLFCQGKNVKEERPPEGVNLLSQKMGIHEWSYDAEHDPSIRHIVPHAHKEASLKNIKVEVELGFDEKLGLDEAQRCLNCDVQTVFTDQLCIECDACVDICPMDCISFTENAEESSMRPALMAPATNLEQDLYVSGHLETGRVMVKDEDVCLHCGLCAERCPTNACDMQKSVIHVPQMGSYAE